MLATTSAAYNSGSDSFIFSNAGTLSGIEAGSFILRQAAAPAGAAITVAAPASGVIAYTLRVPAAAPATVGRFWFGTAAGSTVTSTWVAPDASTVEVSGTTLRAKVGGILGNQAAYAGSPTGQVALGTITGQATPDNTRATVTGNLGLGTITGGSAAFSGYWRATGNIATGTITGGSAFFGGYYASGNIALGTIVGQATPSGTATMAGNIALGTITGGTNGFGIPTGNIAAGTITGGGFFASGSGWLPAGNIGLGEVFGGISGTSPTGNLAYRTVATENLAELAVTTAKIADLNVTTAKIQDANVTNQKVLAYNLEPDRLQPRWGYTQRTGTLTVSSTSYTSIHSLTTSWNVAGGILHVRVQPRQDGVMGQIYTATATIDLKLEVTISGTTWTFIHQINPVDSMGGLPVVYELPLQIVEGGAPAAIAFFAKVNTGSASFISTQINPVDSMGGLPVVYELPLQIVDGGAPAAIAFFAKVNTGSASFISTQLLAFQGN
jgi:hypothetical protein